VDLVLPHHKKLKKCDAYSERPNPLLVEEEAPFPNTQEVLKRIKFGYES
jgi:hypothetical protein